MYAKDKNNEAHAEQKIRKKEVTRRPTPNSSFLVLKGLLKYLFLYVFFA
jgi:hypothetical protein